MGGPGGPGGMGGIGGIGGKGGRRFLVPNRVNPPSSQDLSHKSDPHKRSSLLQFAIVCHFLSEWVFLYHCMRKYPLPSDILSFKVILPEYEITILLGITKNPPFGGGFYRQYI